MLLYNVILIIISLKLPSSRMTICLTSRPSRPWTVKSWGQIRKPAHFVLQRKWRLSTVWGTVSFLPALDFSSGLVLITRSNIIVTNTLDIDDGGNNSTGVQLQPDPDTSHVARISELLLHVTQAFNFCQLPHETLNKNIPDPVQYLLICCFRLYYYNIN